MRISRCWTLVLLMYVTVDFVDPSVPGVFFFDSETLFVDGVVQVKARDVESPSEFPSPVSTTDWDRTDGRLSAARVAMHDVVRLDVARRAVRPHLKYEYPTALSPSLSEDH